LPLILAKPESPYFIFVFAPEVIQGFSLGSVLVRQATVVDAVKKTLSSPQSRGNPHNQRHNHDLRATKNVPISFMPLDKIELERKARQTAEP
jgi:hypothetical protein